MRGRRRGGVLGVPQYNKDIGMVRRREVWVWEWRREGREGAGGNVLSFLNNPPPKSPLIIQGSIPSLSSKAESRNAKGKGHGKGLRKKKREGGGGRGEMLYLFSTPDSE